MARDEAIAAIETALNLPVAARDKLRDVIALEVRRDQDVSRDRADVAAEIRVARRLLSDIVGLAAEDALLAAGVALIKSGVATARDLEVKS